MENVGGMIALIVFYFLPAIIAMIRGHSNTTAIVLLDLFLGWTVIVWLVCLVWAVIGAKQQSMVVNFQQPQQPMPQYTPPPQPMPQPTQPAQPSQPAVQQAPQQAPQAPATAQGMQQGLQSVDYGLQIQYVVGDKIYMFPNMPMDKLNNALSSYAAGVNPQSVLALIDDTITGNAKNGMVITTDAIYAKSMLEDAKIVRLQDIATIRCDRSMLGAKVFINECQIIDFTQPDYKVVENIINQIAMFIAQRNQA